MKPRTWRYFRRAALGFTISFIVVEAIEFILIGILRRYHLSSYFPMAGSFGAIATGPAVIYAAWPELQRKRRIAEGRCPECGYDVRATPNQCPECGHAPSAK